MTAEITDAEAQTQFAQLRELFHRLLALSANERDAKLADLASTDSVLHRQATMLLSNLDESDLHGGDAERVGQRVGPFELEAEIGRGGMGVVYRARRVDGAFEQLVALKLLPVGTRSRGLAKRFMRERQILALLVHPAIVRLLDGGVDEDGRPWLAMELVEGHDLIRACRHESRDIDARVALMIEVCSAVAHAHSCLIVHRDIKPSNILVDADDHPHLLDFGIARLDDDSYGQSTVTVARALTPRYAAPEQLAGERAGTAADIYSLGVVLSELCELPEAQPTRPARRAELARILGKATAIAREDRYSSAAALADDLRDWRAQRILRSGIGSARARFATFTRIYRWPLISVVAVLMAMAVGATLTWRQANIAERQAEAATAHLNALLEVLSAASPETFAAHEPGAGEFLIEAARRLQGYPNADDLMLWRSLSQIGAGLINLNRFEQAQAVLASAMTSLDRIRPRDLERELDTLRLLIFAQPANAHKDAVLAVGERIESAAALPSAPAGPAISALASAASALSSLGDIATTRRWLAQAGGLRLATPNLMPSSGMENYWRQRGWASLRILDIDVARESLQQSLAVIDAQPNDFSALRRAEAELLVCEVELLAGNIDAARMHLGLGSPAMQSAFPAGHLERAHLSVLTARTLLLSGHSDAALPEIATAVSTMERLAAAESEEMSADHMKVAHAVLAQAQAAQADCTAAEKSSAHALIAPSLPLQRVAWHRAIDAARALCPNIK